MKKIIAPKPIRRSNTSRSSSISRNSQCSNIDDSTQLNSPIFSISKKINEIENNNPSLILNDFDNSPSIFYKRFKTEKQVQVQVQFESLENTLNFAEFQKELIELNENEEANYEILEILTNNSNINNNFEAFDGFLNDDNQSENSIANYELTNYSKFNNNNATNNNNDKVIPRCENPFSKNFTE